MGLMHINERGVNVTLIKTQTRQIFYPISDIHDLNAIFSIQLHWIPPTSKPMQSLGRSLQPSPLTLLSIFLMQTKICLLRSDVRCKQYAM